MPVRWDTEARYNLLLMIIGQADKPFSQRFDANQVADIWNTLRDDKVTPRAIQEQVKAYRAEINNGTFGVSGSTGCGPVRTQKSSSKPTTPVKRKVNAERTPVKTKKARKDESEESTHDLTDEAEAVSSSDEDPPVISPPKSVSPRKRSTRVKVEAKAYADSGDESDDVEESASDFEMTRKLQAQKEERSRGRSPTVVGDSHGMKVEDDMEVELAEIDELDKFFDAEAI